MVDEKTYMSLTTVDFDPFEGPLIDRLIPVTEPQSEIWTACMLGGDDANRAYNESISLRFTGLLDKAALERALDKVIRRHEALRSTFSADGRYICVFRELPIGLTYQDISAETAATKEELVNAYVRQDADYLFNLTDGPLLKAGLLKLSNEEHHLTLTAHHLICDGWSVGVLMQDLSKLYSAYVQNQVPSLPAAPRFSQYADELTLFAQSHAYREVEQFWVDQYKGNVPVVNLPTDFPRPQARTFKSQRLDYSLDPQLLIDVKRLGIKAGASFVTTLMAAFEVFLYRLTGQDELVLGLSAAGQSVTGSYGLIGHCVNLLPLRSTPSDPLTFLQFLEQRKRYVFDAYDHQRLTFGSLLKQLTVPRDAARIPLVPVVFNIDMGISDGVNFHGLTFQLISNPRYYENFELYLNATGTEKTLVLEWSYNAQLFKTGTIDRMMVTFEEMLRQLVSNPNVTLGQVPVDVRAIYGRTPAIAPDKLNLASLVPVVGYPADKTIVDLFAEQARQTPGNIAVSLGDDRITYQQLDQRSNQLAHYLRASGVTTETLVPICLERSVNMIVGMLGILKAGGAYVPIDPDYPTDRIDYMLTDTGGAVVVVDAYALDRLPGLNHRFTVVSLDQEWDAIGKERSEPLLHPVEPQHLAYVIYTSGSTGRPKGVLIEHRNVVRLFMTDAPLFDFNAEDVWTMFHSSSFDFSVWEMYGALFYGGRLVIVPKATARDAAAFGELLLTEGVTVLNQTPSAFYVLQDYLTSRARTVPIRYVIFGGEALTPAKLRPWHEVYPCCQLINMYGITETTVHVTYQEIGEAQMAGASSVIGKPIPTLGVCILDESQQVVPVGSEGEMYIGGAGLARGYLNLPKLTAQRFIENPLNAPASRLYRSGDLARQLPDGTLEYLGRIDEQVKIRGYRIELGEIESVLQQAPGIKQGVVLAREEANGDKRLVGYVVTDSGYDKAAVIQALQVKLPDYMVPHLLVPVERIPLTSNGKTDRNALLQLSSIPVVSALETGHTEPRTEAEKLIAGLWKEYLMVSDITVYDDFFELGGHSLIAVQFMMELERKTGKKLPLSTLFEYSTISRLAALLTEKEQPSQLKSLVPIKPTGSKMPIYIIHGDGLNVLNFSGLAAHVDSEQPVYGLQAKGLDGVQEPSDDMEAIAADYIEEILAQNPTGPYAIAGYSFGGYVGIEMARQLKERGKEVKMLAMLDTNTENVDYHEGAFDGLARKVARQIPKSVWIAKSLFNNPMDTLEYQLGTLQRRARDKAKAIGLVKDKEPEGIFAIMKHINDKHDVALANYHMKPYDGVIDLFRADTRIYFVDDFTHLGWDRYALQGVRVHQVPGDHKSMLLPPNDKAFARILQKALDNC